MASSLFSSFPGGTAASLRQVKPAIAVLIHFLECALVPDPVLNRKRRECGCAPETLSAGNTGPVNSSQLQATWSVPPWEELWLSKFWPHQTRNIEQALRQLLRVQRPVGAAAGVLFCQWGNGPGHQSWVVSCEPLPPHPPPRLL